MNRKNLLAGSAIALACGTGVWFFGRQIAPPPSSADTTLTPPAALPSKLKPLPGPVSSQMKAPATPAHEKAFLEEQLKTNPQHAPILLRLGEMERAEGKLKESRGHLEQALHNDPSLVDAHLELGLVCYQLGDTAEAEKQNRAVLKIDPRQPDALYNLGAIYANQNRFAEARQFWRDSVRFGADTASGKNAASALTKLP